MDNRSIDVFARRVPRHHFDVARQALIDSQPSSTRTFSSAEVARYVFECFFASKQPHRTRGSVARRRKRRGRRSRG